MALTRGSSGDEVRRLQQRLRDLGFYVGNLDGDYGPRTFNAVLEFQRRYLADGIVDELTDAALSKAVVAWNKSGDGRDVVPHGLAQINEAYGIFTCEPDPEPHWGKDGWVIVDDEWKSQWLIDVNLPVVGTHLINRGIYSSLKAVLQVIADRGLDGEVKQFGCFAPRHMMHNRDNPLSVHSWAAAVDINWDTNGVGMEGDLDPGIVQAFEMYGWVWGGRWRTKDPMHFQLCTGY